MKKFYERLIFLTLLSFGLTIAASAQKPVPPTPRDFQVSEQAGGALLTWGNTPRADNYRAYYGETVSTMTVIGFTSGLQFSYSTTLPAGTHYFALEATNTSGPSASPAIATFVVSEPVPPVEEPPIEEPPIEDPEPEDPGEEDPPVDPPVDPDPPIEEEDPPVEGPEIPEEPATFPDPGTDPLAGLPQDFAYQRYLRNVWMKSITEEDVHLPVAYPRWDGTYPNRDWLAQLWIEQAAVAVSNDMLPVYPGNSKDPYSSVMGAKAQYFTLAGIENLSNLPNPPSGMPDGAPRARYSRRIFPAAYWYSLSLPKEGNPYYRSRPLAIRTLVTVAVDMMLTDWWHSAKVTNPWGTNAWKNADNRFLGGLMNVWSRAYLECKDVLTSDEQAAFEAGLRRMTNKLLNQGVSRNTPNMQSRTVPAMASLWKAASDAATRDLALRTARKYMFGAEDGDLSTPTLARLFYNAGYVQEGLSPETTYNGVSLYHLVEARAISGGHPDWAFMDEPIRRIAEFRAHQLFPQNPGFAGSGMGPSAYAGRTGGGWEGLQASHPWRDMTIAAHVDVGLPFHSLIRGGKVMEVSNLVSQLKSQFREGGKRDLAQWQHVGSQDAIEWTIDHDHHWPGYTAYAPDVSGWYDRIIPMVRDNAPEVRIPFARPGYYFSKSFDSDFWAHKGHDGSQEWGFFVESEADGGTYGGLRGGSLQAFWTEKAGLVIVGRKNKDARIWSDIDRWASNHLWGLRSDGKPFSSAVERRQEVVYDIPRSVRVQGGFTDPDYQPNPVSLTRDTKFEAVTGGIRVSNQVTGTAPELWATIPVRVPAVIEYCTTATSCAPLGTQAVSTSIVRITKGEAPIYVHISPARQVKLSESEWQQTYQGSARIRNVHIDAKGGVTYELRTRP